MEITTEYEYIYITEGKLLPKRKTRDYYVYNRKSDQMIAVIKWYGPWRQYCFFPHRETIWNKGCLESINQFLSDLN